ncbi:MAG: hypothetical protein J6R82_00995 [Clostridia bacterium]|nr:hypothetical protein [Clostridia bacterium]
MEALKSYLLTAMLASLAASLLIRITDARHRSYIRYIAGLALLLLLTMPLLSLVQTLGEEFNDIDFTPEIENATDGREEFIGNLGQTMSRQIGDLVATQFRIPREAISVKLTLDLADLSAISIYRIDVTVKAHCDVAAVDRYLTDSLHCDVTVIGVQ